MPMTPLPQDAGWMGDRKRGASFGRTGEYGDAAKPCELPSHMEKHGYDHGDLTEAFARFREDRPDARYAAEKWVEVDFQDLDDSIRWECATDDTSVTDWQAASLKHGASDIECAYSPSTRRAGLVYLGSDTGGITTWTDADSIEDAYWRYLTDNVRN